MDMDVFGKSEPETKGSDKIEEALKDTIDAIKEAVKGTDFKSLLTEAETKIHNARKAMIAAMKDRGESEIGLSEDYWKLKQAFHQLIAESK